MEMMYILEGTVEITRGSNVLATTGVGGMIGEIVMFSKRPRNATVRAKTLCKFLLLSLDEFFTLRNEGNAVIWNLERTLIPVLDKRLRNTLKEMYRELYDGSVKNPKSHKSILGKLKTLFTGGKKSIPLPEDVPPSEILKATGLFEDEDEQTLTTLASSMNTEYFGPGDTLFKHNDKADSAFFIAYGEVSIVISQDVKESKSEKNKVSGIGLGNIIGLHSLVGQGSRTTSYIAEQATTVLRLDVESWLKFYERQDRLGSVFRIAVIRAYYNRFQHSGL